MKPLKQIDFAIQYYELGFSIIPVRQNKQPYLPWKAFQKQKPTLEDIHKWWAEWPEANIAIITGYISAITVIDADSEEGRNALLEFIPESLAVPTVKTPKGYHFYFRYVSGLTNGVRIIRDCDIRNDGGYVVAPPGKNENGGYEWLSNKILNN